MNVKSAIAPPRAKKVWLVHGSHTGGHASAARSLKEALDKRPEVETEIINLAETSSNPKPASTMAETALKAGAWSRTVRRWVFDQQFEGNPLLKWVTDKVMAREGRPQEEFVTRVQTEKPDLIVSTMSATNSLLNSLKESGVIDVPLESVVTDFSCHQVWAQENIRFYYVATDAVKNELQKFGVPPEKVRVSGIPIKKTPEAKDTAQSKDRLGLDPSKPTVLMMGGSLGLGDLEPAVLALDKAQSDFQLVTITGKNKEAAHKLENLDTQHSFLVNGYVTNMPEWIQASDLVISKPGGLTSSEVLAAGKPMIVKKATSGLERRMVDGLEATGAVKSVNDNQEMAQVVDLLLSDSVERGKLSLRAVQIGKPDSADTVADYILSDISKLSQSAS